MILHLYFARRFLWIFMMVLAGFFAIVALLELIEEMRRFEAGAVSFAEVLGLTMLKAPQTLYRTLPLVMILTTLALFLGLARSSELVVTRASGRSALRALTGPVLVAFLLSAVIVAVGNPIVAGTAKTYETLVARYKSGGEPTFSISEEGLWLRQGTESGQTVIRAASANLDGSSLYDVSFLTFGPEGGLTGRIEAREAVLNPGYWQLTGAKEWQLKGTVNPEREATAHDSLRVASSLTRDGIADRFGDPSGIPVWQLPAYIRQLERAGFSARRHAVWLQVELARPLFLASMVLIGAGFTMRHTRFGRTGLAVLGAVMVAFTLYFIRNFAQILGETGQLPVLLAAWAPPVSAVLAALGLLLHMEDG